ncbi:MAG TPA: carbohydrate ABC transporter permease [Streptosporangiaceae bacterium]|nr:carbohydrate ABC transporter permease [Streptosporangiaceae bacterium]HVB37782.1 carbohydrate ABC transporter permease [Vicinamibacterales bacterium]
MSRRRLRRAMINGVAALVFVLFAFPVYWMVNSAFKPPDEIQTYVPVFLPTSPTLSNFANAIGQPHFADFLRNSLFVSFSTVALALLVGLLAAVTVARVRFRGRKGFLLLVAIAQMAPFEGLLIPIYLVIRGTPLYNQVPSLIVVYFIFTLPFTIWSLRGFVSGIPVDLEEAAMVDGCSRFGAFRHVVFPLLLPGIVSTAIFGYITAWNEFLYANAFMTNVSNYTLPVWLATFRTSFGIDWGGTMAAATLFTLPVLVFFLIVQGRMVGGLTAGAVKG